MSPSGNYQLSQPGRFRLQHGILHPITTPKVLVVTDLDDTLIGEDESTLCFTEWWRGVGVVAGGRLCYNTGRALDLFLELVEEKKHCMAEPDMLLSAVGTKVYRK